jgi:serine/threonine protein kinase
MPLPNSSHLNPYLILTPLGAGGMGDVCRVRDTRLERDATLKVMRPPSAALDADRRARFEPEARAIAALNPPNIVSVYDLGVIQTDCKGAGSAVEQRS